MDKGLIILAGEDWKQHHRLLLPWFQVRTCSIPLCLIGLQTETCCRAARESTAIAQELFSSTVNAPDVDMHRQFRKLVLETMSRLMLDISLLEKGLLDSFTDDLDVCGSVSSLTAHGDRSSTASLRRVRPTCCKCALSSCGIGCRYARS